MAKPVAGEINPEAQAFGDAALGEIFASAEGTSDPHPAYHRLREVAPVHISSFGGTILTRYDDCQAILRDGRFGNGLDGPAQAFSTGDPEVVAYRREMQRRRQAVRPDSMLDLDPPDHTRQRGLVSRAFTPRRVEGLRARVAELVDQRLDEMAEAGRVDAMYTLAEPLPVSVISELLGVPSSDWPQIRYLVTDVVVALEPSASLTDLKRAEAASDQLSSYFTDLMAKRRAEPADDLISAMLAVRAEELSEGASGPGGGELSEAEILTVTMLLFAAGAETTTNLIGNGLNALFQHPDQLARLWADPTLVESAVDEMLRFDSPVQVDGRTCLEEAEAFGVRFDVGDRVLTLLGAANRDPERFPNPDAFDVGREGAPVMSFGSGIHYCLGANLARMEGQEVFAGLIRRFSAIEPDGDRVYRNRLTLRGLVTCPLAVTPR